MKSGANERREEESSSLFSLCAYLCTVCLSLYTSICVWIILVLACRYIQVDIHLMDCNSMNSDFLFFFPAREETGKPFHFHPSLEEEEENKERIPISNKTTTYTLPLVLQIVYTAARPAGFSSQLSGIRALSIVETSRRLLLLLVLSLSLSASICLLSFFFTPTAWRGRTTGYRQIDVSRSLYRFTDRYSWMATNTPLHQSLLLCSLSLLACCGSLSGKKNEEKQLQSHSLLDIYRERFSQIERQERNKITTVNTMTSLPYQKQNK